MLYKMEARSTQGEMLPFTLDDTSLGYLVKNIDGLDPVKAVIVSSSFATVDGEQYQSSRREKRNIVVKLGLVLGNTLSVSQLRTQLYNFFMPEAEVDLRFFTDDGMTVDIHGYVESFDCPLFAKEPEATISIICLKSDFVSLEETMVVAETVHSVTGNIADEEGVLYLNYEGTVGTGFIFRTIVDRELTGITIGHRTMANVQKTLEFGATLLPGDTLEISTVSGEKGATLIQNGFESSILYGLSPYSNWTTLVPGMNELRVQLSGPSTTGMPYTIEYVKKYGGL